MSKLWDIGLEKISVLKLKALLKSQEITDKIWYK